MFIPILEREINGGIQKLFKFENGFGASVVKHDFSYGGKAGKWELAVIKWDGENFQLSYETHITNDVIGYLNWEDVEGLLVEISTL